MDTFGFSLKRSLVFELFVKALDTKNKCCLKSILTKAFPDSSWNVNYYIKYTKTNLLGKTFQNMEPDLNAADLANLRWAQPTYVNAFSFYNMEQAFFYLLLFCLSRICCSKDRFIKLNVFIVTKCRSKSVYHTWLQLSATKVYVPMSKIKFYEIQSVVAKHFKSCFWKKSLTRKKDAIWLSEIQR